MNAGLRADLHIHTREAEPFIRYSAREVIARAAREGYRVLSITNHDTLTFTTDLAAFARDHGIVLIPGIEVTVEGRHVLIYNADVEIDKITTFAGLRHYRTPEWLVVAPHPFFPSSYSLREKLWHEIELFDAIEFRMTFSLVDAQAGVESVLSAIKAGRVSVVSRPLSLTRCLSILARHKVGAGWERARTWLRPSPPSPQTIFTPR